MDRWVSAVQMQNPLFQPPKHSGNGFLNIDDPPNSWGDPSICSGAALFNLCYPFLAAHASTFLFCLFSCTHSPSNFPPIDNKGRSPTYNYLTSTNSVPTPTAISVLTSLYPFDPSCHALVYEPEASSSAVHHGLAYKPVSRKVVAVLAPLSEGRSQTPADKTRTHFTEECAEVLDLDPDKWLWPEELSSSNGLSMIMRWPLLGMHLNAGPLTSAIFHQSSL
ncbi:hypothetical protein PAXRUDRAFT_160301 [Paxillus rubicundulus Ve08.2h10]|uniref:Uncharacterized protein n=1 Tax=Paxillus rubicundulus Ve08.2h10 TaxID=930991 RepID=A0A0D0DMS6_9AGAM|nr:hypothetical protein PAXRUDRAFT_160301 [Paxillus rubicundulus Ve08.2h10]